MKHWLNAMFFLTFILVSITAAHCAEKSPLAFVPNAVHEFPMVLDGTKIKHDFIIKNKGNTILEVKKVKTT